MVFYGGKGGVGKTTCAAARAVAEAASGARVLVVSTDPAHSLGDALDVELSSRLTTVRLRNRPAVKMDAVELDAPRAFARWIREHRAALGDILEHGTWLDRTDVETMLDLPVPGIDELMGLLEIARFASARRYDFTIVDTAPTGHTLRLLAAPQTVAAVADVLDRLQAEHRYIRRHFARAGGPEASDRLIALIAAQAAEVADTLGDASKTAFHWVTLPEALSIAESADGIAELTKSGIRIGEIVVNQVLPPSGGDRRSRPKGAYAARCALCDRRRAEQRKALAAIRKTIGQGRTTRLVPADLREPHGVAALARLARCLTIGGPRGPTEPSALGRQRPLVLSRSKSEPGVGPESFGAFRGAQLLFIGGKGGAGKTTVAAAVAMRLARAMPRREVLLLSTDPAHSLGDVFGAPIGDKPSRVPRAPENLRVREVNASRVLEEKGLALEAALDEIASALGSGEALASGRAAQLMELAPPGIDELFGMLSIVDSRSTERVMVVDLAPTGHALRLLEIPGAARAWVQVLLRLLLKYRSLVRPGRLAAELVDASRSIRELQALLLDEKLARFIVVTRAAAVPRAETERLLARLRRLKLSVPAVVVNARTLSPGDCPRCRATADAERRELVALERTSERPRDCVIIQTPLAAPPPRGVTALDRWAQNWMA